MIVADIPVVITGRGKFLTEPEIEQEIRELKDEVKELKRQLKMHVNNCPFRELKCHEFKGRAITE